MTQRPVSFQDLLNCLRDENPITVEITEGVSIVLSYKDGTYSVNGEEVSREEVHSYLSAHIGRKRRERRGQREGS